MKPFSSIIFALCLSFSLFVSGSSNAQKAVSSSSVWYAKILRGWFPESMPVNGIDYPMTRLICSDQDITKFHVKGSKITTQFGKAFQLEGSLKLNRLPPGMSAKNSKYMVTLQGYIISPSGQIIWEQTGFPKSGRPKSGAWQYSSGGMVRFRLIDDFNGSLNDCVAVILAIGDPIFINGTSDAPVVLGMKRISFDSSSSSRTYTKSEKHFTSAEDLPTPVSHGKLTYYQMNEGGFQYEVVGNISVSNKKKVFREIYKYQDRKSQGPPASTKWAAKKFNLPVRAIEGIIGEGAAKRWPTQ